MIRVEADEVTYPLHIILRCAAPAPPANARCWMLWFLIRPEWCAS